MVLGCSSREPENNPAQTHFSRLVEPQPQQRVGKSLCWTTGSPTVVPEVRDYVLQRNVGEGAASEEACDPSGLNYLAGYLDPLPKLLGTCCYVTVSIVFEMGSSATTSHSYLLRSSPPCRTLQLIDGCEPSCETQRDSSRIHSGIL